MKKLIIAILVFVFLFLNIQFSYSQVTQEWVQRYNGQQNSYDLATSLAVDSSGNAYVTGYSATGSTTDYATIKYNSSGVQQWVQRYNGPGSNEDLPSSLAVDNSGNVYVTGQSYNNSNSSDYATIKYNSSGDSVWVRRYKGPGNGLDKATSLAVDDSGNVYVTGESRGTTSSSSSDYATIKYNSSGDSVWVKRYNGPGNSSDAASLLAVDDSGSVYVTGSSLGIGSNYDYATIKYNSSGDSVWVKRYNYGGPDGANSIVVDNSGNVYVTGYSYSGIFPPSSDYATIKYNSSGVLQWVQRYNGPGNDLDNATSLAVDNSGNVYVTGSSYGIGTFNNPDYLTIKYNSSGDSVWVQRYNGTLNYDDQATSIAVDNSGNVYVTGWSYGIDSSLSISIDYTTIKYDSLGDSLWVQRSDGPGNYDEATSIAVDNSGNVYVTGSSYGSGSDYDYATIKYSQPSVFKSLDLIALIEGFYNNVTDVMIEDTLRVYLRNVSSPIDIIDSAKSVLDSNGIGNFNFSDAANGIPYYIVIKHRNSIETWSSAGQSFASNTLSYDFTTNSSQAYGNNMVQKGSRFCIYSGDVNQESNVDLDDILQIYNDANNFITGYVNTDVNGDLIADLNDVLTAFNNANDFVSVKRP